MLVEFILKSNNLQYNTLGRCVDGTIVSLTKNDGVEVIFSFLLLRPSKTSEALKKAQILDLDIKVCLKKLGIGPGLYGKSVLYLLYRELEIKRKNFKTMLVNFYSKNSKILVYKLWKQNYLVFKLVFEKCV